MAMMRALFIVACATAAVQAHAQTHALGRLFTTPEERHRLDVGRGLAAAPPAPPPPAEAAPPPPPAPPPVTVNGVVRRSGGQSTVWVNQQDEARPISGSNQDPRVTVTLPSGAQVQIKPGQTVDMATGQVREAGR
jgi:hypothetical protein